MPSVYSICKLTIHEFALPGYIRASAIAVENRIAKNLSLAVDLLRLASSRSADLAGCIPRGRARGESAGRPADIGVRARRRCDPQQAHCDANCPRGQAAGLGGQPLLYRHRLLERHRFYHPVPKTKLASNAALGTEIPARESRM